MTIQHTLLANMQPKAAIRISLSINNVPLEQAFSKLEQQSGYTFLYKKEDIQNLRSKKLDVKNQELGAVLTELFTPVGLTYEIDDKVIIVRKVPAARNNRTTATLQERMVKGTVTNTSGEPLAGTTIYFKDGPRTVFQTDDRGNYEVAISATTRNPTLVFKHVGMIAQEIPLGTRNILDVQLAAATNVLEETIITGGYGTVQKRSDMVGSAYQVTADQIKTLPAQRVDNLLEGLVPGLQVDFNTDLASSTRPRMNLRVRGEASLSASNEPLWIVDGIRVYTGDRTNMIPGMSTSVSPLSYLNPDDIESITVLKDATMASIYGADGANGVVLITTKKGGKMAPSLNFSTRYGVSHINKSTRFKVLNAEQYMELAKESYNNVPGNDMAFFPYQDLPNNPYSVTNTDWYDVYYDRGTYFQNNLNVRGGTENTSYYISGEYFSNKSTIKGNQQDRLSLRSNIDFKLTEKLNLGLSVSASYNIDDIFNPGTDYYSMLPIISPYNDDGSYRLRYDYIARVQDPLTGNDVLDVVSRRLYSGVAERAENDNMQRSFYTVNNLVLDYQILPELKFTSQIGANFQSNHEELYQARTNWSGMTSQGEPVGYSTRAHANFLIWSVIERLNYNKSFGNHHLSGLLGFEASSQDNKSVTARGAGFANDHIKEISYAATRENGGSNSNRVRRSSFFGQAAYNYDQRYYLTINGRADGNSDFGDDSQWGTFYSVGSSWNIHNESFFHSSLLNVLKVKASFGTNGNSRLGSQRAQGMYNYNTSNNYLGISGTAMANVWNRELSWEHSYMTNIGVRANFKQRVDVELEVYNKKTVDLLQEQDVSRATGDTRVTKNVGSTQNRGIELTVESMNIDNGRFKWFTQANISRNQNKLLELYKGIPQTRDRTIWTEGEDLSTYYLVRWAGVDPRDGAPLWYDAQGNITRVFNLADRVPGRTATPSFHGGLSNTFTYGGWSLHVLATYTVGGYGFGSFGRDASSDGLNLMTDNQSVNQLDRWQNPGDLALSPQPLWQVTNANSTRNSTRYLYEKTFLRLKNIALSYNLPESLWLKSIGLKGVGLSFVVDNIGVWTPYDKSDRNSYKQAMSGYPMERTYSMALNIQL